MTVVNKDFNRAVINEDLQLVLLLPCNRQGTVRGSVKIQTEEGQCLGLTIHKEADGVTNSGMFAFTRAVPIKWSWENRTWSCLGYGQRT